MDALAVILIVALIAWAFFWAYTLVQILRTPDFVFERAGQIKLLWIFGVLIFQFFGVVAFYAVLRPKLQEAAKTQT